MREFFKFLFLLHFSRTSLLIKKFEENVFHSVGSNLCSTGWTAFIPTLPIFRCLSFGTTCSWSKYLFPASNLSRSKYRKNRWRSELENTVHSPDEFLKTFYTSNMAVFQQFRLTRVQKVTVVVAIYFLFFFKIVEEI